VDWNEIFEIGVSVLAISVAFSIGEINAFPIILITVGLGFILHELAHRFVARHYGAVAFYKAWPEGLLLMFAMAVISGGQFVFAAPGAVYIYSSYLTRRQNGIISISGAVVNLILAILFVLMGVLIVTAGSPQIADIGVLFVYIGAVTNLYLALFNMIPIPPLDGSKVFAWNKLVWVLFTGIIFVMWYFFAVIFPTTA
jgi:Zn-dependent protease